MLISAATREKSHFIVHLFNLCICSANCFQKFHFATTLRIKRLQGSGGFPIMKTKNTIFNISNMLKRQCSDQIPISPFSEILHPSRCQYSIVQWLCSIIDIGTQWIAFPFGCDYPRNGEMSSGPRALCSESNMFP